ncbi:DUF2232 domain-containing protein [Paenibacillus sp. IITD108]|uniref:DUF2232 domain-containing protein n=1 Tax=Paenibacillus sp. IITD108 TaxID=3116649 RepID=UPI002F3EB812
MKTGLKPVLWSAAALITLLLLVVPVLNFPALWFIMVPFVVLYTTLPRKSFVLCLIPIAVIASIIINSAIMMIGLFFVVPSIVMGHLYQKGASAGKVIRTVSIVFLAQIMLELLLFKLLLDYSLIKEIGDYIRTLFQQLADSNLLMPNWNSDMTELMIRTVLNAIPLSFIMLSFLYTVFTHFISRRILNKQGMEIAAFPQAKDWRLPRILVFYYLIAYVGDMMISPTDQSFIAIALLNLVPLLSYVFAIQAIGLFFFIADQRGWHKSVPLLLAIPVLLFPPLSLIGVLDTAFPIRKSFTKS